MRESASPLAITLPAEAGMVCKVVGMEPDPIKAIARNFCSDALPAMKNNRLMNFTTCEI